MATAKKEKEKVRLPKFIFLKPNLPTCLSSAALISIILDKCVQRLGKRGTSTPEIKNILTKKKKKKQKHHKQ